MKENSIQVIKPIARKRRFKRKLVMHKFLRFLLISFLIVMLVIVWRSAAGEQNSGVPKGGSESNMTENIPVNEDWRLRLVNSGHSLPADYPVQLEKVQGSHQVDERIAGHVTSMIQAAGDDGVDLLICSSYRSVGRQQELFDEEIDKYMTAGKSNDEAVAEAAMGVAVPGHSEHSTGLALDIVTPKYQMLDSGFEETDAFKWLDKNAHKYGFILRYPKGKTPITKIKYEPWHYRYVGQEHAPIIKEKNLTLEEYLEYLKDSAN
ncbi:MAG TPA: D-Ala-D-Ala carboxypeptidase VanY [Clostridiales bacterium]|nr:M15 family metallopeptidase [Clostridia bacterium]MDD4679976.1 M15 family metallopeptidase [Clostridia bacterium]HCS73594.1 D-Ala-D-Ala carboxypeptidase VanY [Clostridiales bacterium]